MRVMAPQDLSREHARQKDVVGKLRLARALGAGIDFAEGFADYLEWLSVVAVLRHDCRGGACPRPIVSLAERAGTSPAPTLIRDQKYSRAAIPSLHHASALPPAQRL